MIDTTERAVQIARVRALVRSGAAEKIRVASGLTISEVARAVGVYPSTVFRWESGSRVPRGERAVRYLQLLERLLGRENR